jgi:hypothetical protein
MRERGQASVETIALTAAAVALAAALTMGVIRLGPPLASALGHALSGVVAPTDAARAPGLDALERALLAGATGPAADGPTLLDLRTRLGARLDRPRADAVLASILRPLVDRALAAKSIRSKPESITIVDRATEDAWIRRRFHPGLAQRIGEFTGGLVGGPAAVLSVLEDIGVAADEPPDGIQAGFAAGDVVVQVSGGGYREVILRRRAEQGLVVVLTVLASDGPAYPVTDRADRISLNGAVPGGSEGAAQLSGASP